MIRLRPGTFSWTFVIENMETGSTIFVQTDYDLPGLAQSFGWVLPCECGSSDGTVDCPCGTASEFISDAREYLSDHIGDVAEDPGYFPEEA